MELFERVLFQDHLDMIYNEIDILIKKKDNQGITNSDVFSLKSSL